MIKIELRKDGWFDAGKNAIGFPHKVYNSKQKLKKKLEEIAQHAEKGLIRNLWALETALSAFPEVPHFRGPPYLRGSDILIDTHGLPGKVYLGNAYIWFSS